MASAPRDFPLDGEKARLIKTHGDFIVATSKQLMFFALKSPLNNFIVAGETLRAAKLPSEEGKSLIRYEAAP